MTPDHLRLSRSEAAPAILRLHRALSRLRSVITVMNTGAHPDDEQSGLLAWFRFGLGIRVVVACSTRGEGGQNILGPERGGLLAALRTREMEEAARVLDADVAWLGQGPDDPVHDFGFAKDAESTFARWGEDRIVRRIAQAYRHYRPDVVIPTFLDVPGQHGHHRAMTRAAEAALTLAAGPDPTGEDAWRVPRFYLPAWSGAGGTYDDTEPPPPATLHIRAGATEPATGASYAEIGEWSRRRHASQGMGHWPDDPRRDWGLHWLDGRAESGIADDLPPDLAALARVTGAPGDALATAAEAIAEALAAFPDGARCAAALAGAAAALDVALDMAGSEFDARHGHRLRRKRREVGVALAEAAGLRVSALLQPSRLAPGQIGRLLVDAPAMVSVVPMLPEGVTAQPDAADGRSFDIHVAPSAPASAQFLPFWDALGGNGVAHVAVTCRVADTPVALTVDLDTPVTFRPDPVAVSPDSLLVRGQRDFVLRLPAKAPLEVDAPPGWDIVQSAGQLTVRPPATPQPGYTEIRLRTANRRATQEWAGEHPHVGRFAFAAPALIRVLMADLHVPADARIAFIAGTDRLSPWFGQMGLDVAILDRLTPETDWTRYDTVLIGPLAFGARGDLADAVPGLHRFVEGGGHLVTLYQNPGHWNDRSLSPRPLRLGTPSFRWRVTDPAAPVTIIEPDHPLLTGPNRIGPEDFDGWHKERGLYFASDWDPCYRPLLSVADPGEAPLTGGVLSGRIGAGRHSHVSLVLHHQIDRLVPGAFRLLANLLQRAT